MSAHAANANSPLAKHEIKHEPKSEAAESQKEGNLSCGQV